MEGGVDPIEEGIQPGDLVFVLRETRHRTFRRLTGESPHLTADITVSCLLQPFRTCKGSNRS